MGEIFHPGGIELTKDMIGHFKLKPGSRILDVGCGSGQTVYELIKMDYKCMGIDINEYKVDKSIKDSILKQDITKKLGTQLINARFDAIISECSLSVCGNLYKALENCNKLLDNDGKLLISDVYFADGELSEHMWKESVRSAGFNNINFYDKTNTWKRFYAQMLWNGYDISKIWGSCINCNGRMEDLKKLKAGYFIIYADKKKG